MDPKLRTKLRALIAEISEKQNDAIDHNNQVLAIACSDVVDSLQEVSLTTLVQ